MSLFKKSQRKETKAHRKMICLYFSTSHDQVIIAPFYKNYAGIYYEQDVCTTYSLSTDNETLGNEIISAFYKFEIKDKDLARHKKSDWPAYKHSKTKTMKSFEECYVRMELSGANEANIILEYFCEVKNMSFQLHSAISLNAEKSEIGKVAMELHDYSVKIGKNLANRCMD